MDSNFLRWVTILVLLAHGVGHILGFLATWVGTPVGFGDQPWVLSTNVTINSSVGRAFGLLWLMALLAFLGAVLALQGHQDWWRTLAIIAAFISLVAILPWWNTVSAGVRTGAVLADILVIAFLLPAWGADFARNIQ